MCGFGIYTDLALGDPIRLCVFVSTAPIRKMVFMLKVDEYAKALLHGSARLAVANQSSPLYTWVATSQTSAAYPLDCDNAEDVRNRSSQATCPQLYAGSSKVAELLSLVITLDKGRITSLDWDNGDVANGCAGCGPSFCMYSSKSLNLSSWLGGPSYFDQGSCGFDLNSCTEDKCNLSVLVTWVGTDRDGRNAVSAGIRLSKFTGYTLNSLYDTMRTAATGR